MAPAPPPADEDEITRKLLDDLWQRLLPQTTERLYLLEQASNAAATQTLTADLRTKAAATAHKFAGSLGMFGFHEGTRIALRLEQHLDSLTPDSPALVTLIHQLRSALPSLQAPSTSNSAEVND